MPEPTHPNQPSNRRVFLSYARGDDEPFVRRLHDDLVAAGFTVWFDREALMSRGLTFHQEIRDAIRTEVDRVVYVGGPKAAQSAYVREEWALALEFDHVVVTPILRLGDYGNIPGELSLLHCEDFRDDAAYASAQGKLINNLRQPNPKLGALFAVPTLPAHFLGRPELMKRVRDALLVDLQTPQVITSADARVGMQGMGGIGKSVLAAALARNRQVRESYPDGVAWVAFGQNLGEQELVSRQRDLARHLGGSGDFDSLEQGKAVLREQLQSKSILLVLDDLWRARDSQGFDVIGPRCRMLVTTRDAGILHALNGDLVQVSLFTEVEAVLLLADTAGVAVPDLPVEAEEVAKECGFLPLALALSGGMAEKRGGDFGSVLERLRRADLEKIADRESINPQHRDIWKAMQASVEMLSEDEQRRFTELAVFPPDETVPEAAIATLWAHSGGLEELDVESLLIELSERSLVQFETTRRSNGETVHRIFLHDLLYDYVVRSARDVQPLHLTLLDAYQKQCPDGWTSGPDDGWFLQRLRHHLVAAGRLDDLAALLLELRWLERKVQAGLTFDLAADLNVAVESLPSCHAEKERLRLIDEALRRDIHFIARHAEDYPQGLFQCLWNSCWWFDCPEAAPHYENDTGPPSSLAPERKLSGLLESWRSDRGVAHPGFAWLRSLRPPLVHLGTAQLAVLRGHGDKVTSVAFSPDGQRILSGSWDRTVRVWDATSGAQLAVLRGHESSVHSVAYSLDGRRILSGSTDQTVRVWDAASGAELAVLRGHTWHVNSVAYSPDGQRILSGAADNRVRVWDAARGTELAVLRGHESWVISVAYSPDGLRILSGSWDETVRVWDATSGAQLAVLRGHESSVHSVAYSLDGRRILSGSDDRTVRVWDAASGAQMAVLRGHEDLVCSVAYSSDGRRILSGSDDRTVRVWDAASGAQMAVLRGHEDSVRSVTYSPDGQRILSGSDDRTVRVWDAASGAELAVLRGHRDDVSCKAYSPDGRRILSGSWDRTVRVWDATSGAELAVLRGHEDLVCSVAYSPDGQRILSGSTDQTVRVWDAASGAELAVLRGHRDEVRCVAYSPDGRRILSGSDETVRVWDAASGAQMAVLRGHRDRMSCVGYLYSVAYSPDGQRILSGSDDRTVRVWDAASGAELAVLRYKGELHHMGYSPDGQRIFIGCHIETRVWNAQNYECLEVFQSMQKAALAARLAGSPFWPVSRNLETSLESPFRQDGSQEGAHAIAWLPVATYLTSHPSGRYWAGRVRNYLALFHLEGE